MSEKRKPVLYKIGCYFEHVGTRGFEFFKNEKVLDGSIFIYNQGILWRVEQSRTIMEIRASKKAGG